jgi:hypothetical protein
VPDEAKMWVRMDNNVLLACANYADWCGYNVKDIQGAGVGSLVIDGARQLLE